MIYYYYNKEKVDDIMNILGLLVVAGALFFNLKAYKNLFFTSKKKKKEQEQKYMEAMEMVHNSEQGKKMTDGLMGVSFGVTTFFHFLFYSITAIIASNPIMFVLAGVIVLLNSIIVKNGLDALKNKVFPKQTFAKMALPLKTAYIIGFIALVFI